MHKSPAPYSDACCASSAGRSNERGMQACHIISAMVTRALKRFSIRPSPHPLLGSDMPCSWPTVAAEDAPHTLRSNPSDDERVGIIVATLACTLIALIVLSLRVFVRAKIIRNFGWNVGWRPPFPM